MKKAKPEDRREYWKLHAAALAFEKAGDVASRLLDMEDNDDLFLPLMIALHALYARPFRHDKNQRRMEETLVPGKYQGAHEMALHLRDTIYAHHDKATGLKDSESGVDLFQLILLVEDRDPKPGMQMVYPTEHQLRNIRDLCGEMRDMCYTKGTEALSRCIDEVPEDGVYRVSTDFEGRAPLLIPSELSTEQSRGHLKETMRRAGDAP